MPGTAIVKRDESVMASSTLTDLETVVRFLVCPCQRLRSEHSRVCVSLVANSRQGLVGANSSISSKEPRVNDWGCEVPKYG
jgi:hypothetical protein